ncbi:MAG: transposase [Blastocatellia bacterium]|nr:transposase [Blastocatellia bacterium]
MREGTEKKFDSEYERRDTAAVFLAFEPLTGKRLVRVSPQRTKTDYCRFQQEVVKAWPQAEVIVEVQDNLNTHNASSFYENLPPPEARALSRRIKFHYTPKKASWLNMAEMELSALARQCLARRIADIETLRCELDSIVKERNKLAVKFKWQFTVENAREKLSRHYGKVILKTSVTKH